MNALTRLLVVAVGGQGVVSVQNPLRLDDRTEPEPDVAVLRPRADDYRSATPGPVDVLLVVEVADTSLGYDRAVKAPLYAARGVPELWIVDLAAREVEVHRAPEGGRYTVVARVGPGGALEPGTPAGGVHPGLGGSGLTTRGPQRPPEARPARNHRSGIGPDAQRKGRAEAPARAVIMESFLAQL